MIRPSRRAVLGALAFPALAGCAAPIPATPPDTGSGPTSEAAANDLLAGSAAAHGFAALAGLHDISVGYTGQWRGVANRIQPALVDAGYRGASEERLLLADRLAAQSYSGPDGHKQVLRHANPASTGEVSVWYNGTAASDPDRLAAAALVADGYELFLLGPMLLAGPLGGSHVATMRCGQPRSIWQDSRLHPCDVLLVDLRPGIGLSAADRLALYIDTNTRLMRRVRFTLDGLESTRGAVAEVDTLDHLSYRGIAWPTRFHEQLLRPFQAPVHDWRLVGLDMNRGLDPAMLSGSALTGAAAIPVQAWTT